MSKINRWRIYRSDLGDYMHRWILATPWGTARLYRILQSDEGRDLHDHPFDFVSVLLTGGYVEHLPDGYSRYWPRWSVVRRKAEDLHRLELCDGPVWTLVFTGRYRRTWGFQVGGEWMPWKAYHAAGRDWHNTRVKEIPDG